jgi:hypothetical protein
MSRRGTTLAIAGGLVLVALIALLVTMRGGDDDTHGVQAGSAEPTKVGTATPTPHATGGVATTEAPRLPQTGASSGSALAEDVREYAIGDRRVRDHRKGTKAPIELPPAIHPPDSRKVDPMLTRALGEQFKVVMKECTSSLPVEARGATPRLEALIVIAIKNKQATVTKSFSQLRDVVGASVEPVKQCIEQKSLGLAAATEEADLDSYDINLSYAL